MGTIIFRAIYIFIMAVILAALEVQIEAENGWAKNIPTWHPDPNKWYSKLYKKIMGGKELTGYHLFIFTFVLLIFHLPFFFNLKWTIAQELNIICIFLIFVIIWDYLWFVINPHFTIKDFKGDHIFWHSKWLLNLPTDYWGAVAISLILGFINDKFFNPHYIEEWFIFFIVMVILTLATKWFIKTFKPEWE
ncbi:MAG TPA: hypothetical protein PLD95_01030 [bacterium]|jgi:heme/copper-type cytochrome/quinol oxidase subunit 4|nr:hypothetical protein [bacterium]HOG38038.1 hypothetical protein [bacterium]